MNDEHVRANSVVNNVVVGFLCGAAVGAGIALLTAPSSGVVTRRRIGVTARKVANTTRERFDRIRGRIGDLRRDFRESVTHGAEEMNNAAPR